MIHFPAQVPKLGSYSENLSGLGRDIISSGRALCDMTYQLAEVGISQHSIEYKSQVDGLAPDLYYRVSGE